MSSCPRTSVSDSKYGAKSLCIVCLLARDNGTDVTNMYRDGFSFSTFGTSVFCNCVKSLLIPERSQCLA